MNRAESPTQTPEQSKPSTAGLIAILAGLAAVGMLATNIMLPSFPIMADALAVSTRDLGVILSSFFLAFAIGQVAVGPLSDRYGRKPIVLGGLALFLVGTAIAGLASSLGSGPINLS